MDYTFGEESGSGRATPGATFQPSQAGFRLYAGPLRVAFAVRAGAAKP